MTSEQVLLTKWQDISQDRQKQVLDFMDFLYSQDVTIKTLPSENVFKKRLQHIRTKITDYSRPL